MNRHMHLYVLSEKNMFVHYNLILMLITVDPSLFRHPGFPPFHPLFFTLSVHVADVVMQCVLY